MTGWKNPLPWIALMILAALARGLFWHPPVVAALEPLDLTPTATLAAPPVAAIRAAIDAALAQGLFEPDRRALAPVILPGDAGGVSDLPRLVGVLPGAALFSNGGDRPLRVAVGDRVGDWRLVAIEGLYVTIERGDERRLLDLAATKKRNER